MNKDYKIEKDLELYGIYPLSITKDRYGGVYSGGKVLAIDDYTFPPGVYADDTGCFEFWRSRNCGRIGVGNTIHEAIVDLARRIGEPETIGVDTATACNQYQETRRRKNIR